MMRAMQSIVCVALAMLAIISAQDVNRNTDNNNNNNNTPSQCDGIPCNKMYLPVCGSDGKTYGNECMFGVAQCKDQSLSMLHKGHCDDDDDGDDQHHEHAGVSAPLTPTRRDPCDIQCTEEYEPMCGSDGKTYDNKCYFGVAVCRNPRLALLRAGQCTTPARDPCDIQCTEEYEPMCGSDGNTYDNKCYFGAAVCRNPRLALLRAGECGASTPARLLRAL